MRESIIKLYFDLCGDYRLYRHLPHTAIEIYDIQDCSDLDERAITGAAFLLAQKLRTVNVMSHSDIATIFVTTESLVLRAENRLMITASKLHPLCPVKQFMNKIGSNIDSRIHKTAMEAFDLSLFEKNNVHTRCYASIKATIAFHTGDDLDSDESICAKNILHKLRSKFIA